jgi:hypothetical protein
MRNRGNLIRHARPQRCILAADGARVVQLVPPSDRERARGMPGAGRNPWPACSKKSRRQSPQVQPTTGIPRAMVLRLYRALLGVPGLLATVATRIITRATWHQRRDAGTTRLHVRRPAFVSRKPNVHRIPASRVVTIARNAPLNEAGCRENGTFLKKRNRNIFAEGLDAGDRIESSYEFSFSARAILAGTSFIPRALIAPDGQIARRSP